MLDKKTFFIGILALSAVMLFVANLIDLRPAYAGTVIKDRDFQLVTAQVARGDDALYVLDNRTGQVAVFVWNLQTRRVEPRDVRPLTIMFPN